MKHKVVMTEKAASDIDGIASYMLQSGAGADTMRNFINRIYDGMENLSAFSDAGSNPRNRSLLTQGYKFIVCGQYIIFYRMEDAVIYVADVFDSKNDCFRYCDF